MGARRTLSAKFQSRSDATIQGLDEVKESGKEENKIREQ